MDEATANIPGAHAGYRVLARKYRPSNFDELIGQAPMVRTLTNAFRSGRIAQAFMLTGIRGVGKTTTARILARALNYSVPGTFDRPSIDMLELGEHCAAIMEGRHIDVIEMDAASHTGIDDVREITDASRYRPAIARYKVYIIDEVHMLSNQAFNGLLKTLEEPPEHVKFIFATTEIRKVPVTVLSRCQRFDLRRIDAAALADLIRDVAGKEGIAVDEEAIRMLARAGDGSARDTLSLLDQASAHGGEVRGEDVRAMLGLADRARLIDLFEALMRGDVPEALTLLGQAYDFGADPMVVLQDLAAFTHLVTRLKVVPAAAEDPALTEDERARGRGFAEALSLRVLSRVWQMLLKGIAEVQEAARPLAAAEMVLIRIAHATDLPTPDEALRAIEGTPPGGGSARTGVAAAPAPRQPSAVARPAPAAQAAFGGPTAARRAEMPASALAANPAAVAFASFDDLVAHAAREREIHLKLQMERHVRLIRFEPGRIDLALTEDAAGDLVAELSKKLQAWTGTRWVIAIGRDAGAPTIEERRREERERLVDDARADPLVASVLSRFPGAEIVDVRVHVAPDLPAVPDPTALPYADPDEERED